MSLLCDNSPLNGKIRWRKDRLNAGAAGPEAFWAALAFSGLRPVRHRLPLPHQLQAARALWWLLITMQLSPAVSRQPRGASAPSLLSALCAGGADLLTRANLRRGDLLGRWFQPVLLPGGVIELLREQYRINSITWRTDIQTVLQQRPAPSPSPYSFNEKTQKIALQTKAVLYDGLNLSSLHWSLSRNEGVS